MIKEEDLLDAIAECQGQRDPNANTCIKMAAYYTILDHIRENEAERYSYASAPEGVVTYMSASEFSSIIEGKNAEDVWAVIDELMDTLHLLVPRLYNATIEKLRGI